MLADNRPVQKALGSVASATSGTASTHRDQAACAGLCPFGKVWPPVCRGSLVLVDLELNAELTFSLRTPSRSRTPQAVDRISSRGDLQKYLQIGLLPP